MYVKALLTEAMDDNVTFDKLMSEVLALGDAKKFMYMAMEVLGHHNSPKKAIELFEYAVQYYPDSSEVSSKLANAYGLIGKKEGFKDHCTPLLYWQNLIKNRA